MTEQPMYDVYQEYYHRVKNSKTFSEYCNSVYDIDFSQDGFCDRNHIDFMINKLGISQNDNCLDIGCGNGKIAEYISKKIECNVSGIDYSSNAISEAQKSKNNKVEFHTGNINELTIERCKYNIVYLIDSIYFSNDYSRTIKEINNSLQKNGKIAMFYSEVMFKKENQKYSKENETHIGEILHENNYAYQAYDLTSDLYEIMKKKKIVANKLKNSFIKEGNVFLYDRICSESIETTMTLSEFEVFSPRYLYIITKKEES
jgi:ubiquinone/menaquinone biosynthesis C-methylase UbiE